MASVKDNAAKIFMYINYQIQQIKTDIENVKQYREYCLANNKKALAYECLQEIGTWEWEIKDLEQDKQFYIEYFGFTKQDLNGQTMNGKYLDLDKRVATQSEVDKDWDLIIKEMNDTDKDWDDNAKQAFQSQMGIDIGTWREVVAAKF